MWIGRGLASIPSAPSSALLFSFPFLPFVPSPPFPFPPLSLPFSSFKSRTPQIPVSESGVALWATPAKSVAAPQPKSNLVHYSFKMWSDSNNFNYFPESPIYILTKKMRLGSWSPCHVMPLSNLHKSLTKCSLCMLRVVDHAWRRSDVIGRRYVTSERWRHWYVTTALCFWQTQHILPLTHFRQHLLYM